MSDLDAQVRDIKDRLAVAQRARARAEHEFDAANAKAAAVATQLQDEFGVSTIAEATTVLNSLEQALIDEVAALRAALDDTRAGGPA